MSTIISTPRDLKEKTGVGGDDGIENTEGKPEDTLQVDYQDTEKSSSCVLSQ